MKPALVLLFAAVAWAIQCTDSRGLIVTTGGALVSECSVGVNCPPLGRCNTPDEAGDEVTCDVLGQWTWRCETPSASAPRWSRQSACPGTLACTNSAVGTLTLPGPDAASLPALASCAQAGPCPAPTCCQRDSDHGSLLQCGAPNSGPLWGCVFATEAPYFRQVCNTWCGSTVGSINGSVACSAGGDCPVRGCCDSAAAQGSIISCTAGNGATKTFRCSVPGEDPVFDPVPPVAVCPFGQAAVGSPYSSSITGSGGSGPYRPFAISGAPGWLSLNTNTGALTGASPVQGSYTFTVTITDSVGATASRQCPLVVTGPPSISCVPNLPQGQVTVNYVASSSTQVATGSGPGGGPYTYTATFSSNVGMRVRSDGRLESVSSNGPTSAGTVQITVTIRDGAGGTASRTCPFTIITAPTPQCPGPNFGYSLVSYTSSPVPVQGGAGGNIFSITDIQRSRTNAPAFTPTFSGGNFLQGVLNDVGSSSVVYTFGISVQDRNGATGTVANCQVTVYPRPTVACPPISAISTGQSFSSQAVLGGGDGSFQVSITSTPSGLLSVNNQGLVTSGVLNAAQTITYTLSVTSGTTRQQSCTLKVLVQPNIACPTFVAGQVGAAYGPVSPTTNVASGDGVFSIVGGSLPNGLNINSNSGQISSSNVQQSGTFNFRIRVRNNAGVTVDTPTVCSLTIGAPPVAACPKQYETTGRTYSSQIGASGGKPAYVNFRIINWNRLNGPASANQWISVNSGNGALSGTAPGSAGRWSFTVQFTDDFGVTASASCEVSVAAVPVFSCPSNLIAPVNELYSVNLDTNSGTGVGPLQWQLIGASGWLSINQNTGVLSGTPQSPGTQSVTIRVTDSNAQTLTVTCEIVATGSLSMVCPAYPIAYRGSPFYGPAPTIVGGAGPRSFRPWEIRGGRRPAGLDIDRDTGVITGTVDASQSTGSIETRIRFTDAVGDWTQENCQIIVADPFSCPNNGGGATILTAQLNRAFTTTIVPAGGNGPFTFTLSGLPANLQDAWNPDLTLNPTTGVLQGTPTSSSGACGDGTSVPCSFLYTVTVRDNTNATQVVTCRLFVEDGTQYSCQNYTVTQNSNAQNIVLTAPGRGSPPFTFQVTWVGDQPPGYSLIQNGATATIRATFNTVRTYRYCVQVSDRFSQNSTNTCCNINVVAVIAFSCPSVSALRTCGSTIQFSATGGSGNYDWQASCGSCMSRSTGLLTIPATSAGPSGTASVTYTVTLTDVATGQVRSATCPYTLNGPYIQCPEPNGVGARSGSLYYQQDVPFCFSFRDSNCNGCSYSRVSSSSGITNVFSNGTFCGQESADVPLEVEVTAASSNGACTAPLLCTLYGLGRNRLECPNGKSGGNAFSHLKLTQGQSWRVDPLSGFFFTNAFTPSYYIVSSNMPNGVVPTIVNNDDDIELTSAVTEQIPAGSYEYTLLWGPNPGINYTVTCPLEIVAKPVVVCPLNGAAIGVPYASFVGGSGEAPLQFEARDSLPAGLSLNSQTGEITGTPTAAGTFNIRFRVRDNLRETDERSCPIEVALPPTPLCFPTRFAKIGDAYSSSASVTGCRGGCTFSAATSLPSGFSLSTTGVLSASSVSGPARIVNVVLNVTDAGTQASQTISCPLEVVAPPTAAGCPSQNRVSVGQEYSSRPSITGGSSGTVSFYVQSGSLPAGVNPPLLPPSGDGLIRGRVTAAPGTYNFVINATDAAGQSVLSPQCTITVYDRLLMPCPSVAPIRFGETATETVSAAGGLVPYTITILNKPSWITLSGTTLNFNPGTNSGTFSYSLRVTDGAFGENTTTCQVVVNALLSVQCPALLDVVTGVDYNRPARGNGGRGSSFYTYSLVGAPQQLSIVPASGVITGTFTGTPSGSYQVRLTDGIDTVTSSACPYQVFGPGVPSCPAPQPTQGAITVPLTPVSFSVSLGTTSGRTFSVVGGSLPQGVSLNGNTGQLSGTPTASGAFSYSVRVRDSAGSDATVTCNITIAARPVPQCPVATASVTIPYLAQLRATGGVPYDNNGTPEYNFTIVNGALPSGLALNNNKTISGAPNFVGTASFFVQVTDSAGLTGVTGECAIQVGSPGCNSRAPASSLSNSAAGCVGCASCKRSANPCFSKQCSLNAVLLLDESGSIGFAADGKNYVPQVREGVISFLTGMQNIVNVGGNVKLGVITFSSAAQKKFDLNPMTSSYFTQLSTYVNTDYLEQFGSTNWADALNLARTTNWGEPVDIFVVFTDGNPQAVNGPWTCAPTCYNYQSGAGQTFFSDLCSGNNTCDASGVPEPPGLTFQTVGSNEREGLWAACYASDRLKETGAKVFMVGVGDVAPNEDEIQVVTGLIEWNLQPETFFTSDYVINRDYNALAELFEAVGTGLCPCLASSPACANAGATPSCSAQVFSSRVQVTTQPSSISTTFPPASSLGAYIYYQYLGGANGRVAYDFFTVGQTAAMTVTPTVGLRKDILNPCQLQRVVQCGGGCFIVQERQALPRFFREAPDTPGTAGSRWHSSTTIPGCTGYTKVYPTPTFAPNLGERSPETIKYIWVANSDGFSPCAAEAYDGTLYEFYKDDRSRGVMQIGQTPKVRPAGSQEFNFVVPPGQCTTPKCARPVEMIFVIDDQSIAGSEIPNMKDFVGDLILNTDLSGSRFGFQWTGNDTVSVAERQLLGANLVNPGLTDLEQLFLQPYPPNFKTSNFARSITAAVNRWWPTDQSVTGYPRQLVTLVAGPDAGTDPNRFANVRALLARKGVEYWAIGVNVGAADATLLGELASTEQYVHYQAFATGSFLSQAVTDFSARLCPSGNLCGQGCRGFCGCESIDTCVCPPCTQDNCTAEARVCRGIETGCSAPPKNCNLPDSCLKTSCDLVAGCRSEVALVCNDTSRCTIDTCVGSGSEPRCNFARKSCVSSNKCLVGECNPVTGDCDFTPVPDGFCNTGNKCTRDRCDPAVGCVSENISALCTDNNACTRDSCSNATGCVYVDISAECNDGNLCKIWSCNITTGCQSTDVVCNDGNDCTLDSCNPSTGCVYEAVNPGAYCNDTNACTIDICEPEGGCQNIPVICNDNNRCTTDTCNPTTGCVYTPKTCDDSDPCTDDACQPSNGLCEFIFVPTRCAACGIGSCGTSPNACQRAGCIDATSNVTCNDPTVPDSAECFQQVAGPNRKYCYVYDLPTNFCNDQNECTVDSCNITTGCVNAPISCDDGNACTRDSCDPLTGCVNTPIPPCNDNKFCTIDSCNTTTGCVFTPRECTAPNNCTISECSDNLQRCVYTPKVCDSRDACIIDSCDPILGCQTTAVVCNDDNECTEDSCDSVLGCQFTPKPPCDDNDPCTTDLCDPQLGCVYEPLTCQANTNCTTYACVAGTCEATPVVCDDTNPCTTDTCSEEDGGCQYTPIECFTASKCENFTCNPSNGLCEFANNITCSDGNSCTTDECLASQGCVYRSITCPPGATACEYGFRCEGDGPRPVCIYLNLTSLFDFCGECLGSNTECFFSSLLGAGEISGITAGVIAGIVVAAIIAALIAIYLSKKGYDYYSASSSMNAAGATTNPYFVSNELAGENVA